MPSIILNSSRVARIVSVPNMRGKMFPWPLTDCLRAQNCTNETKYRLTDATHLDCHVGFSKPNPIATNEQTMHAYTAPRGSIRRGARAVHARCGYWGCSIDPFIQSQSGGMVTPQSPREVVQIPVAVRTRCTRGARAVRILPPMHHYMIVIGPSKCHSFSQQKVQ